MRVPKHNLPKKVHKPTRTVKHKKSKAKLERLQKKALKAEEDDGEMMTDEVEETARTEPLSESEKLEAKLQRKKANIQKNAYKRLVKKTKHFR
mmetsp:Transcript_7163/g.10654  ORF Transcript_7163/g.10654 Transcript_7163/m.10654 type:complete len:93 (+) Transcript_7163:67-345(+)